MAIAPKSKPISFQDKLLKTLSKVNRPGDFCTAADRPITMPGLEVEGIGLVGLPLPKSQARKLIKLCRQAPYGKGTETVVDTAVRRVWELDEDQFTLSNPQWSAFVDSIVDDVKKEMGLEQRKLAVHLYKLLVYEKGGFFLPHRDGEKLDGMVATLVIALPSIYQGGELIVAHDGQEQTVEMTGAATGLGISYAAFYADCEHEVRPLTSGYRLCLTYNVTLKKSKNKKGVTAPSHGQTAGAIAKLLDHDWVQDAAMKKMAVTLDHRYTQDGLTVEHLKGVDRARAEVLFAAAEKAGFVAHLALITLWLSGSAEGGFDDYSPGGRRGRYYNRYEDEDEESVSDHEMGEVFDDSLSANFWSEQNGNNVSLGEIHFERDEVVSQTPLEEWKASREEFEGYTGNAGMTLERWYHRAAIVLWPRDKHFDVLCDAGTDAAIGGWQVMVKRLGRVAKSRRDKLRQDCIAFAAAIINSWRPKRAHWSMAHGQIDAIDRDEFPAMLCELDDAELVQRFISQVMLRDSGIGVDQSFVKFCNRHGWKCFETELAQVLQKADLDTVTRNVKLIERLCVGRDRNSDRLESCQRLCELAVNALASFDQQLEPGDWQARKLDRATILASLVKAMLAANAANPLRQLINHALAATEIYDLTDAHLAAIFTLKSRIGKLASPNKAILHWLQACRGALADRTATPPQPPADFCREHKLPCDCRDCRILSKFLADPADRQLRLPLAKQRRQHLHQIIDGNDCDLTHATERRGRPFTLVCTKTDASYEAACLIHQRDLKNLASITKILGACK